MAIFCVIFYFKVMICRKVAFRTLETLYLFVNFLDVSL